MASCLRLHPTTMLQAGHSLLPRRWHCSDSGDFRGFPAVILEFGPRIGNRCIDLGDFLGFRAVILDFRPRLGNRCTDSGHFRVFRAAILEFRPRIGNQCSNGGLQAKLIFVAATKIRVGRGISQQRRLKAKFFGRALLLYNLSYVNLLL